MAENDEKVFLTVSSLGAIFGFIIPLIMWAFKKDDFSDYTKRFLTDILNFELILFIAVLILTFIPLLGWLVNTVIFIFNLIVVLKAFSAVQKKEEYSFPFNYKLID